MKYEGILTRRAWEVGGFCMHIQLIYNLVSFVAQEPISVVRSRDRHIVTPEPLPYKGCVESYVPLEESDQLEFKAGQLSIGTFYANDLPKYPSTLLLMPSRQDEKSMAATSMAAI